MATVPARESDLPDQGGERGPPPAQSGSSVVGAGAGRTERSLARVHGADPRLLAALTLLVACAVGLRLALNTGVVGVAAVPTVLRTAAMAIAFFALCGYPVARILLGGELTAVRALLVLPLGATVSSLALAVLGLLHVPLAVSLAILIAAAVVATAWVLRRRVGVTPDVVAGAPAGRDEVAGAPPGRDEVTGARPAGTPWVLRAALPLALAGVVALCALLPIFRSGYATVPGQNGDAILVVGTAVLLEHAPPTATRTDTPIPSIPLEWRSKYPIYYALAAVSTLAGQDPIQAFPTVAALMLALAALGFFLFARYVLRAPLWLGLLVLFVLPLDRIAIYVADHPYYNELWGQFALPFLLLFGWRYLNAPDRRTAILLLLFAVLCLLAYPLVLPFPAVFLIACAVTVWRRRRVEGRPVRWISGLELPRPGPRSWLWIPIVAVAVPVVVVLGRGFLEKTVSALQVILPGSSLAGWSGSALPFLPFPEFVGMPSAAALDYVGLALVCLLAAVGLSRVRSQARWPLGAMVLITALIGVYFRGRTDGELFYFKDLAFVGPYLLMLALLALGSLVRSGAWRRTAVGVAGIAAALVIIPAGAGREVNRTFPQADRYVLQLRTWNRELPRGSSVLVDIYPSGWQLWASYMLVDHPLATPTPLDGIFPHPAIGFKADYLIALRIKPPPRYAVLGQPILSNAEYELWRMNPSLRAPEVATRPLIYDLTHITIG
ncbi:MAG TPA: hypothetical protein VG388_14560 [Solirubrobacteraceae bacterium]|nr:hypothetical protein [Solirubrobacteraceae bacterium]